MSAMLNAFFVPRVSRASASQKKSTINDSNYLILATLMSKCTRFLPVGAESVVNLSLLDLLTIRDASFASRSSENWFADGTIVHVYKKAPIRSIGPQGTASKRTWQRIGAAMGAMASALIVNSTARKHMLWLDTWTFALSRSDAYEAAVNHLSRDIVCVSGYIGCAAFLHKWNEKDRSNALYALCSNITGQDGCGCDQHETNQVHQNHSKFAEKYAILLTDMIQSCSSIIPLFFR